MFFLFRCKLYRNIAPTWIHSESSWWSGVRCSPNSPATFVAHPPDHSGFGQTGRTNSLQPTALSRIFLLLGSFVEGVFSSFIRRFSRAAAELLAVSPLSRLVGLSTVNGVVNTR
jgi:hypothetical protein